MEANDEQSKASEKISDNVFIEVVRKKIRKANKKMQRIAQLEESLKKSGAKINEDQKILLDSKETTLTLLKEFYDLQSQMTKLDEQAKGSVTVPDRKDREARKEKKKQKAALESNQTNVSTPTVTKEDSHGDEKRQDKPQVQKENVKPEEKKHDEPKSQDHQSQHHNHEEQHDHGHKKEEGENEHEGEARNGKKNPDWMVQKDIYVNKYKQQFGPEHENQFVAIVKGQLLGPYASIAELKKAHSDMNLSGAFYAKIGHEDEPLEKGAKGRGRGGYSQNRRGSSDRGRSTQHNRQ